VFGDFADKSTTVEDCSVIIDISQNDSDLGIASQRRLYYTTVTGVNSLVVGQHVEVPDGATSRQVAVQCTGDVDFTSVRVDDERAVVGKLTRHSVTDS